MSRQRHRNQIVTCPNCKHEHMIPEDRYDWNPEFDPKTGQKLDSRERAEHYIDSDGNLKIKPGMQ